MNEQERWQEQNARYLSTALTWLRLRLERLAQSWPDRQAHLMPLPAAPVPVAAPAPAPKRGFLGRSSPHPAPTLPPAPTPAPVSVSVPASKAEPVTDEQIKQQADALADLAQQSNGEAPPALVLDTHIASLCARAQDNPNQPYPPSRWRTRSSTTPRGIFSRPEARCATG